MHVTYHGCTAKPIAHSRPGSAGWLDRLHWVRPVDASSMASSTALTPAPHLDPDRVLTPTLTLIHR